MSLLDKLDNPFIPRLAQQEAMSTMEITCDEILSHPDPRQCIEALVSVIDPAKLALRPWPSRTKAKTEKTDAGTVKTANLCLRTVAYGIPQQGIHRCKRCIQNQKICFMVNDPFSSSAISPHTIPPLSELSVEVH
jgi:hypothetical protein